ncbi:MAG TPA: hypothetical protein VK517_19775 [Cyclobacteriaceae bacterium]|nr:hypothetical protein [Cyclobacteriaceae bacterium]
MSGIYIEIRVVIANIILNSRGRRPALPGVLTLNQCEFGRNPFHGEDYTDFQFLRSLLPGCAILFLYLNQVMFLIDICINNKIKN